MWKKLGFINNKKLQEKKLLWMKQGGTTYHPNLEFCKYIITRFSPIT
jgi:hypothetical protein